MLTYVLAVLGACANTTSSVLQRKAGRQVPRQEKPQPRAPIVSILWGVFIFHEQVRGGWFIALAVGSGLVMVSAVVALARSPLLSEESGKSERRKGRGRDREPARGSSRGRRR